MQRQRKLQLGDARALGESWAQFTDEQREQREQVRRLLAGLIARAVRATHKKEQDDDAAGK